MRLGLRRNRQSSTKHKSQRGLAALEFAFVFPIFVVLMCGIFTFSLAYLARQLLGNMASDTARTCALRSANGLGAVQSCVQSVGHYLAAQQPGVCGINNPVSFTVRTTALPQQGLGGTANYPSQGYLVVVTASCNFTFKPGIENVMVDNGAPISPPTPSFLQGNAAMPFTIAGGA